ncbi:BTAD domain-containing putative transcriptional regulator [Acrocarpospora sp. B8E8]|uniref:AfsR/SARP family transcriptional regulator n=1 Tax=Acrocarpospora sp. B8E8 TaxID=3153572 RepID=UPI00325FA447
MTVGGEAVQLRSVKQRILLSTLAAHAGRSVSVQRLMESLWESPPVSAAENLRTYLYQVRRALGDLDRIAREPGGFRLVVRPGEMDAESFEELAREGDRALADGRPARASEAYGKGLALWRGPAFGDLAELPLVRRSVLRLTEARLRVVEQRITADLDLGRHTGLIAELTALVADHPLRERPRAQLMLALHRSGRQADALGVYREGRQILVRELGLEPGPELRELHEAILRADAALGRQPATVRLSRPERPSQLPADIAAFAGRREKLAELDLLTRDLRIPVLVGLTGLAGVGKTALALRWAHSASHRFPDGKLFADLRGYGPRPLSPGHALDRFLRALGVRRVPGDPDERAALLRSVLSGRRVLIVLDNAREAAQVRPLLPGSPGSAVLVTGRNRLDGLAAGDGAHLVRLAGLNARDSLALLAAHGGPDADAPTLERLAALCAGLPLALRTTAARLSADVHLSARELADRLAVDGRRLDELSHGDVRVRTGFAVTYATLTAPAAALFRGLGLLEAPDFPAGVGAALLGIDAESATTLLRELVGTHLLEVAGKDDTGTTRYRFHDLVRLYARERAVADAPRDRGTAFAGSGPSGWSWGHFSRAEGRLVADRPRVAETPVDLEVVPAVEPGDRRLDDLAVGHHARPDQSAVPGVVHLPAAGADVVPASLDIDLMVAAGRDDACRAGRDHDAAPGTGGGRRSGRDDQGGERRGADRGHLLEERVHGKCPLC